MPALCAPLGRARVVLLIVLMAAFALGPRARAAPLALGVNIDNAPGVLSPLQTYTSQVGRPPAIIMWYQSWSEPLFYSTQLPNTASLGAIPSITWQPQAGGAGIPLARIVAGAYDSYIVASAKAAAQWGGPMFIRFAPEMNIASQPYGVGDSGNTPALFIAAWRHIVSIFRQQGATNVEWIWSPNTNCNGTCSFTAFYPGDAWVDWVALDGYNYASVDNMPWRSFDQVFGASYAELTTLTSKPVMIGETGSTEQGGNKAAWITQAFGEIPAQYPAIRAVVWFDRKKETDWRVDSSPATLAAWQAVVSASANQGTPDDLLQAVPLAQDVDSQQDGVSSGPPVVTSPPAAAPTTPTLATATPPSPAATPTGSTPGPVPPAVGSAPSGSTPGAPVYASTESTPAAPTTVSTPAAPTTVSTHRPRRRPVSAAGRSGKAAKCRRRHRHRPSVRHRRGHSHSGKRTGKARPRHAAGRHGASS